jgi:acetoacetate decarboxylase
MKGAGLALLSNQTKFMYPLTPTGRASLLALMTEPSHRIVGNKLVISFDAEPSVVRDYVPEPLQLDGSGRVFLNTFEGFVYTDRNTTGFVPPDFMEYRETYFFIPCDFNGERYHYMLYSWVDRDWLAFLGRHVGMPHKISDVSLTHFHAMDSVYDGPKAGVRLALDVRRYGQILRATVDLDREVDQADLPFECGDGQCPRFLGRRFLWDSCEDRPAKDDLVAHWGDSFLLGPVWRGEASLEFFDAVNEEVLPFAPVRIHGGWYFTQTFDHSTSAPRVIYDYLTQS